MTDGPAWVVERHRGRAGPFHALDPPRPPRRTVWVFEVGRPALVIGSTQPESDVDRNALAAGGVDLVRRRSGGGAVLLVPGEVVWIDVVVPRGDPLWSDDIGQAFHWLGDVWAETTQSFGIESTVHKGRLVESRWSRTICFAGVGSGEVLAGGRKVIGLSQRRQRDVARFQCCAYTRVDAAALAGLLRLTPEERQDARRELDRSVTPLPAAPRDVEAAFLAVLAASA